MAQNITLCQFCETSSDIKWKCVDCDLILCDNCKIKLHTKLKHSNEHNVIDLKEFNSAIASETRRTLDLKKIPCSIHERENCSLYCRDCKKMLCFMCLMEVFKTHPNHKFSKLEDVYKERKTELEDLKETIEENLPVFTETQNELKTVKSKNAADYNKIKQTLLQREGEIKDQVSKQVETLISQLDSIKGTNDKEISKQQKEVEEGEENLQQRKTKIDEVFLSDQASPIFTLSDSIDKEMPPVPEVVRPIKVAISPQKSSEGSISLGTLITIPTLNIQSYKSDLFSIVQTKTLQDGTNILFSSDYKSLYTFVLKDSECVKTKLTGNMEVYDMTVTSDGKLLFSDGRNEVKSVTNLTPKIQTETFISIAPLYTKGIHATNKNIFIGFEERRHFFSTENNRGGIMVYDYNCRHMRTIEYNPNNDRLFTLPHRITTNINGDICVVDNTGYPYWEGRVVVLDEWGKLKWIYTGHPSINSTKDFTPTDVLTTPKSFILVADHYSHTIHLLSMDGDLLTSLSENIAFPFCLTFNNDGHLLIGGYYKMYMVHFSDYNRKS